MVKKRIFRKKTSFKRRSRKRVTKTTRKKIKRVVMSMTDTKYRIYQQSYQITAPGGTVLPTTGDTGYFNTPLSIQFNNTYSNASPFNPQFYTMTMPLYRTNAENPGYFRLPKGPGNDERIGDTVSIKKVRFNCRIPVLTNPAFRTRIIVWRHKPMANQTPLDTFKQNIVDLPAATTIASRYLRQIPVPNSSNIEIVKYTEIDPPKSSLNFIIPVANNTAYAQIKDYKFSIKRKQMKFPYDVGVTDQAVLEHPTENWYYHFTYAIISLNPSMPAPYTYINSNAQTSTMNIQISSTIVFKDL